MRWGKFGGASIIVFILLVIVLILILVFWLFFSGASNNQPANNEEVGKTTGTITGSLSYPSEMIPAELTICAVERDTVEEYCTTEHITDSSFAYGKGYSLVVPAGVYYVYSYLPTTEEFPNEVSDYRAYYSEFVTCGQTYDCTDHTPIEIVVTADTSLAQIDPVDWYAPEE